MKKTKNHEREVWHLNFDFLALYKMDFQNYKIGEFHKPFTTLASVLYQIYNFRLRLEFVGLIQHDRSCSKRYIKRLHYGPNIIFL